MKAVGRVWIETTGGVDAKGVNKGTQKKYCMTHAEFESQIQRARDLMPYWSNTAMEEGAQIAERLLPSADTPQRAHQVLTICPLTTSVRVRARRRFEELNPWARLSRIDHTYE